MRPKLKLRPVHSNKRYHVRFPASADTSAGLAFTPTVRGKFTPEVFGLVVNEFYKGCCLIVLNQKNWQVGSPVWIKVGEIGPIEARIRWVEMIASEALKVGIEYLE